MTWGELKERCKKFPDEAEVFFAHYDDCDNRVLENVAGFDLRESYSHDDDSTYWHLEIW
jgi:hypothetical protein